MASPIASPALAPDESLDDQLVSEDPDPDALDALPLTCSRAAPSLPADATDGETNAPHATTNDTTATTARTP
ncbi:MAG: hypothetical protein K0V04_37370 [Deltaproteobacteria bacterium]|nr:hypothetical protein [Deltaproteobacteria bacterium]